MFTSQTVNQPSYECYLEGPPKSRIFSDFFVGNPKQDDMILCNSKQVQFSIFGLANQENDSDSKNTVPETLIESHRITF